MLERTPPGTFGEEKQKRIRNPEKTVQQLAKESELANLASLYLTEVTKNENQGKSPKEIALNIFDKAYPDFKEQRMKL